MNMANFVPLDCMDWTEKNNSDSVLTQDTNSGLRGHLEVGGHHILDGKTSTFLFPWSKWQRKKMLTLYKTVDYPLTDTV